MSKTYQKIFSVQLFMVILGCCFYIHFCECFFGFGNKTDISSRKLIENIHCIWRFLQSLSQFSIRSVFHIIVCRVILNYTTSNKEPQRTATNHNEPQRATTNHNKPQRTTASHNHNKPQWTTTSHNKPQSPTASHNHPQLRRKINKTHKKLIV